MLTLSLMACRTFVQNSGSGFTILSTAYLFTQKIFTSLNHDIGVGPTNATVNGLDSITDAGSLPYRPNLSGPRIVLISSSSLGSGYSVHASKNVTDIIGSIDLTQVDSGFHAHFEYTEGNTITFNSPRNASDLDIILTDEHEEILELAPHYNINMEWIVTVVLE